MASSRSPSPASSLSPSNRPTDPSMQGADVRLEKLRNVYREFDLDGSGDVGFDEMLALGQVRRKLGHKSGEWTVEKNNSLMINMGADKAGNVTMERFVSYFDDSLPVDAKEFDINIKNFLECGRSLRVKKQEAVIKRTETSKVLQDSSSQSRCSPSPSSQKEVIRSTGPGSDEVSRLSAANRMKVLRNVFEAFDLDNSGVIEPAELLALGEKRRELGQKSGVWSREKNRALVNRMDKDGNGKIDSNEFVTHFLEAMRPMADDVFLEVTSDFMMCAAAFHNDFLRFKAGPARLKPNPFQSAQSVSDPTPDSLVQRMMDRCSPSLGERNTRAVARSRALVERLVAEKGKAWRHRALITHKTYSEAQL